MTKQTKVCYSNVKVLIMKVKIDLECLRTWQHSQKDTSV